MQDMNQQVPSLDAIGTSRLNLYEAYNERSDSVGKVTLRGEEKQPVVYRRRRWNMNKEEQPVVYRRRRWKMNKEGQPVVYRRRRWTMNKQEQPIVYRRRRWKMNKEEQPVVYQSRRWKMNKEEQPVVYRRRRWKMNKEKQLAVYSHMKWTDEMVKLLIIAASYIGEDVWSSGIFPKKGKWSGISNAMAERGHCVSPHQCEEKFNDLNKKFKRLNDILGRGTACSIVADPVRMEIMDLTHDVQEEVKKLLSSEQLFYQEMCSYNNQNRLFLPDDLELQQSVLLNIKRKDTYESEYAVQDMPAKRKMVGEERVSNMVGATLNSIINSDPNTKEIHNSTNHEEAETLQNEQQIMHRLLQLEGQKLQIQAQILELEKQRIKCLTFRRKEERELQEWMLENKAMILDNERMALELNCCETSLLAE